MWRLWISLWLQLLSRCHVAGNVLPVVKKSHFDAPVVDILWLGKDREIVMLYTERGTLHRSSDQAGTFEETKLHSGQRQVHVVRLLMSPNSSFIALAVGNRLETFATDDAGLSWHEIHHPNAIRLSFMFHPNRPEWALLSAWTEDCRDARPGSPCTHQLLVTRDLGRTALESVSRHVVQFSWGRGDFTDRIYFTHFRDKNTRQPMLSRWMESVDFVSTDDFGKHVTTHVPRGNKFVVSEQFTLVAQCLDPQSQNVQLMVRKHSTANRDQPFEKAFIPTNLAEKSYAVLDASEGFVLLHVNHGEGLGNVYVSDDTGTRYVLSLQHNIGVNGRAAFEKVSNLKGIYFANVWAAENATGIEALPSSFAKSGWLEHGDYQLGEGSTMSQAEQSIRYLKARPSPTAEISSRRLALRNTSVSVHSLISFNAGGAWSTLKAPSSDSEGQPISCGNGCSLHLHDMTFQEHFVPFYSYDKAVGIIMAAGNVGQRLSYKAEESNTYLSRDGGLSWSEVRKGVHIYEFGNHGAVLVMASVNSETNQVIYSLDEGKTWQPLHLDSEPFNVTNILIEPTAVSTDFVAFGSRGQQGVIYRIDFDALDWPACHKDSEPDVPGSDYETWAPSDGQQHHCPKRTACGCLLGQQVAYVRRKQLHQCFNRRKSKLPVISQPCHCTMEDFECELDFERALDQKSCVATVLPPPSARFGLMEERECAMSNSYKVDVYRRVPGNRCVDGWVPPQLDLACPPKTSSSSHGFLKFLLVGVAFSGCVYMGKKGSGDWFSWTNPYMAFTPGAAQGRSIGRVGVPTELPEVAVPRYHAPSLVQF